MRVKYIKLRHKVYWFVRRPPKKLHKLLVVTRSEKGSVAINGSEIIGVESQKDLKIIDLTGAGDLFAAGFLHGYINKMSDRENLQKGTEMASKVIQKIGARLI